MKISDIFRSNMVSGCAGATTKQTVRGQTTASDSLSGDTLELSEGAQKYAQLNRDVRASMESVDSNEDTRVQAVAKQISEGTYQPNLDDVVDRMMYSMA
jgi:anti-sigma28 factor (negative regulator of flagellin synthesis)